MQNCQCELRAEQARLAEKRTREAVAEAAMFRTRWEAAASCLAYNAGKITPRGQDEKAIIEIAKDADHGVFWSGKTSGWSKQ